jgi:hypothetical protein
MTERQMRNDQTRRCEPADCGWSAQSAATPPDFIDPPAMTLSDSPCDGVDLEKSAVPVFVSFASSSALLNS